MGQILSGTDIMVFLDGKSIAFATNHTLTIGSTSSEVSTKDDAQGIWQHAVVQKLNWSATTENMYSLDGSGAGFEDLFAAMTKRQAVKLKFGLESTYANKGTVPATGWSPIASPIYSGDAYITDLSWNNPNGDNSTFTATFTGTGQLIES